MIVNNATDKPYGKKAREDLLLSRRRRDRLTIMAQILNIARKGIIKTQIMYRADLSFIQLNEYLSFLQEVKLLEVDSKDGRVMYKTTSKGFKYLQTFAELKACMYATCNPMTTSNMPSFSFSEESQVFIVGNE